MKGFICVLVCIYIGNAVAVDDPVIAYSEKYNAILRRSDWCNCMNTQLAIKPKLKARSACISKLRIFDYFDADRQKIYATDCTKVAPTTPITMNTPTPTTTMRSISDTTSPVTTTSTPTPDYVNVADDDSKTLHPLTLPAIAGSGGLFMLCVLVYCCARAALKRQDAAAKTPRLAMATSDATVDADCTESTM